MDDWLNIDVAYVPDTVQPRLSEPLIIRNSEPSKNTGQSTNIGHDIDVRMHSRVQCSHRLLCSCERVRSAEIAFKNEGHVKHK